MIYLIEKDVPLDYEGTEKVSILEKALLDFFKEKADEVLPSMSEELEASCVLSILEELLKEVLEKEPLEEESVESTESLIKRFKDTFEIDVKVLYDISDKSFYIKNISHRDIPSRFTDKESLDQALVLLWRSALLQKTIKETYAEKEGF